MKAFHHLVNRRPGHQAIDRLVPHHLEDLRFLKDLHRLLNRSLFGQLLLRRPSETEIITNSNAFWGFGVLGFWGFGEIGRAHV